MHTRGVRSLVAVVVAAACNTPAAVPPGPPWVTGPTLPSARLEPGVTALGDRIVVIGGFVDARNITGEVDTLDTIDPAATWDASLPPLPEQWTHMQVASIGTRVYILGGLAGGFSGNDYVAHGETFVLETSDPVPAWQALTPIPSGFERGSAGVVVAAPRVFLLGGATSSSPDPRAGALADSLVYDTQADTWCVPGACADALPDLPAPRSHPAAMREQDGTLIVAGGLSTLFSIDAVADVFWLLPQTTGWIAKTPMPDIRGGCAYGTIGGRLVCAGGEEPCAGGGACALIGAVAYEPYEDDGSHDPWCTLANLPTFRGGTQGGVAGDRLFVPGGAEQIALLPQDTLFEYSTADDPALEPIPDTASDTKLCKN